MAEGVDHTHGSRLLLARPLEAEQGAVEVGCCASIRLRGYTSPGLVQGVGHGGGLAGAGEEMEALLTIAGATPSTGRYGVRLAVMVVAEEWHFEPQARTGPVTCVFYIERPVLAHACEV